jgi:hypothetical protein
LGGVECDFAIILSKLEVESVQIWTL